MGNDYEVLFGALDTVESKSGISVDEQFEQLRVDWKRETVFDSLLEIKQQHPIYQQIIGLGADVVPVLFFRICQGELEWSAALTALTEYDPYEELEDFTFDAIQQSWINWNETVIRRHRTFTQIGESTVNAQIYVC